MRSRPSVRPGRSSSAAVCPRRGQTDHQGHTEIDKTSSLMTGRVKQVTHPDHSPPPGGKRPTLIRPSFIIVKVTFINTADISYKPLIRTEFGVPGFTLSNTPPGASSDTLAPWLICGDVLTCGISSCSQKQRHETGQCSEVNLFTVDWKSRRIGRFRWCNTSRQVKTKSKKQQQEVQNTADGSSR